MQAYNDAAGVAAAFNLNLLQRINRELDGDFDLEAFSHDALYNPREGRIEMHIVSRRTQEARVCGLRFRFERGETIHTENSYKYMAGTGKQRQANLQNPALDCRRPLLVTRALR